MEEITKWSGSKEEASSKGCIFCIEDEGKLLFMVRRDEDGSESFYALHKSCGDNFLGNKPLVN